MGLVNAVVPLDELERETVAWCREMSHLSPLALRLLKSSFNAEEDGLTGLQQLSHDATLLFYMTEEGQEGRNAYQRGPRARLLASTQDAREPSAPPAGPPTVRIWLMAARPRTLPAAIAPVLVGTAAAVEHVGELPRLGAFIAALSAASSSRSGPTSPTTTPTRSAAPTRSTASGRCASRRPGWWRRGASWSRPGSRSRSPSAAGVYLPTVAGPVILAVGAVSILAGVLYTGGPRPYGYAGLGELFVFLFFGLVAVNGSYYVQLEELECAAVRPLDRASACSSTAILVVNNVRDIDTDRRAGKNTLAVRLGRERTRRLYVALVARRLRRSARDALAADGPWWVAARRCSRSPLALRAAEARC